LTDLSSSKLLLSDEEELRSATASRIEQALETHTGSEKADAAVAEGRKLDAGEGI
jgi:hypothetical protein